MKNKESNTKKVNGRGWEMNEKLKEKMINEKTEYLMNVKHRIVVLTQERNDGILTEKGKMTLEGLYKIEYETQKEILKLYSID